VRARKGASFERRRLKTEHASAAVIYGDALVLKFFRHMGEGMTPDLEIGKVLTVPRPLLPQVPIPTVLGALGTASDGASRSPSHALGLRAERGNAWDSRGPSCVAFHERVVTSHREERAEALWTPESDPIGHWSTWLTFSHPWRSRS